MLAKGTSSSSATICDKAVTTPVPRSTLLVKTVTLPSWPIASQESSEVASGSAPKGASDCPRIRDRGPAKLKLTMRAPVRLTNCLREIGFVFIFEPPDSGFLSGGPLDRTQNPQVTAAAA